MRPNEFVTSSLKVVRSRFRRSLEAEHLRAGTGVLTWTRRGALALAARLLGTLARLLSPVVVIRLAPIKCRSFGNFLLEPELRKLEALDDSVHFPKTRRFDIFFCGGGTQGIENSALREIWSREIFLTDSRLAASLWSNYCRSERMKRHVNRSSCRCRDERNLWDKYESRMRLTPAEVEDIYNALEELKVRRSQRVALLHVRDTSYDQLINSSTSSFDVYRNSNPVNYQLAVDELNNRGFAVIAIGNQGSWSRGLRDVVDYSGSQHRSELRDVSIGAISSLYLGSESAPSNLAMLFRKPQLITNNSRIAELVTSSQLKMHIFKEHRFGSRRLTHSRIWESNLAEYEHDSDISESGLELVENTPEDIRNGLIDLLTIMGSENRYLATKQELTQQTFWELFAAGIKANPKFSAIHGELRALVAPSFLRSRVEWTL